MNLKDAKADIEVEKKLLSALMLKGGVAISEAVEVLQKDDFYRPEYRLIYRALVKFNAAGTPLDILLVERELELSDNLKRVTRSYLYGLLNLEHTTGRVPEYAAIIKELVQQRELVLFRTSPKVAGKSRLKNKQGNRRVCTEQNNLGSAR